ncbi:MAG: hypothetical protein ACYS8K_08140 [Planctomycetota bacterium]|jgi:hypothetical protein
MPRNDELPAFFQKRKILFNEKTSPEKMRRTGQLFMAAERYDDALEFFARCEADDLTRQVSDRAMEAGNTALYMRAKRVLDEDITEEEWTKLAAAAESAGAHTMAYVAHQKAGHQEEAARLREMVPGLAGEAPLPEAEEAEADPAEG